MGTATLPIRTRGARSNVTEEYEYLVKSLIENTVSALKGTSARGFWTEVDDTSGRATLTIAMFTDSWDERADILRNLANVRCLFLDDLSIEFLFSEDEPSEVAPSDDRRFAYAS